MTDLYRLTAREAVALLRNRQVSPLELIDAALERIAVVEPQVNALPIICADRARERAKTLMGNLPDDPPPHYLFGLPVAIKDMNDVAGVRTTYGSRLYADNVAKRSDYMVEALEASGAVVLAKSNTPEFAAGANTFNDLFGATLNPWDCRMTCGGSSGGAAVALATGEIWLAHGSDHGGSLRIPASFCGVVGLRPASGRVPRAPGALPFSPMSVQGPMARTVADLSLMLDAQLAEVPGDPLSLPRPLTSFLDAAEQPTMPRRVAYSADLGIGPIDPEVRDIVDRAAAVFADLGATVEHACPDLTDAENIFGVLRAQVFAATRSQLLDRRAMVKPEVIWNIEEGLALTGADVAGAERAHAQIFHRTAAFFETHDLLLSAAVLAPPFPVGMRYLEELNGHRFPTYFSWLVLSFAITLTHCPAISVPCGMTASGLPVGLQIVGPPRGEAVVLAAAALFEAAQPWAAMVPLDPCPVGRPVPAGVR
ncbi:MAG: amidase [Alphaproteobacteria bacterium]|nr:amidase [Alphaproteobacteria bacterium]